MRQMSELNNPLKLNIKHLKNVKKIENDKWEITLNSSARDRHVSKQFVISDICLEASIEQNIKGEIFLVNDNTGKAKIINCKAAAAYETVWTKGN